MNPSIQAAYVADSNRLVMKVPFALNEVVRSLPSRRFDPKSKMWSAPLLSANLRAIREAQRNGVRFEFMPEAEAAITRLENSLSAPRTAPFPRQYVFRHPLPMKHQAEALDRAWPREGFGLFMDMGTGKSRVVVDLACARWNAEQIEQVLILPPLSVRSNWVGQWASWATIPVDIKMLDAARARSFLTWADSPNDKMRVLIAGVEGLGISAKQFDMLTHYVRSRPTMVVIDESSKIKNPSAVRTQRTVLLANAAGGAVIMNGTPIANGIEDLYSQVEAINPNIIGVGDYYAFRNRYCIMGGYENKQIVAYSHLDELMETLAPWVYQVRKADVLTELPPKVYEKRTVTPTPVQKDLLHLIKKQPIKQDPMTGEIPTKNILERMLRLQQVVGGFYATQASAGTFDAHGIEQMHTVTNPIDGPNPKIDALMDILEEATPQKVVIWARYIPEILTITNAIQAKYGHQSVVQYYGAVSEDDRTENVRRFQTDPTCRFFVGAQAAGGLGIELFAATVEVYFSNSFAYIDRQQSEDRAHRKGQLNSVTIIDLIMEGTIDEVVIAALEHKQDVDKFVRESLSDERNQKGWVTRSIKE